MLVFCTSLTTVGNSGCFTWVRHSSPKSSTTHSYQCVQHFPVSKQWYGCQRLGFLTCAQTLMHAIAHGGCTNTVSESAQEADSGTKILCSTGQSNPHWCCVWFFRSDALPLCPHPITSSKKAGHVHTHKIKINCPPLLKSSCISHLSITLCFRYYTRPSLQHWHIAHLRLAHANAHWHTSHWFMYGISHTDKKHT